MKKLMIMTVIIMLALNFGQVSAQNSKDLASNGVIKEKKIEKSGDVKELKGLEGNKAKNTGLKSEREQKLLNEKFESYLFGKYIDFNSIATKKKPLLLWRKDGC